MHQARVVPENCKQSLARSQFVCQRAVGVVSDGRSFDHCLGNWILKMKFFGLRQHSPPRFVDHL